MNTIDFMKNILTFIILYLPPIILFFKIRYKKTNKFIAVIIFILYIAASMFTQNLFPFILTVIDIIELKKRYRNSSDYCVYSEDYNIFKFNISSFSFIKGMKYSATSYLGYFIIMIIFQLIFSALKLNLKEQDVVTWLSNMPLNKFIIVIPVTVIFAPIAEEFVFRWFIFEKILKNKVGIIFSAILSSILFAFIHYNIKVFPGLVFIALFNCYLMHKEGFWYAVFNHFIFNFVNTSMLFFTKL